MDKKIQKKKNGQDENNYYEQKQEKNNEEEDNRSHHHRDNGYNRCYEEKQYDVIRYEKGHGSKRSHQRKRHNYDEEDE